MKSIRVVACGAGGSQPAGRLLDAVAAGVSREFRSSASISDHRVDAMFAHHPERNQYHSTAIIDHLSHLNGHREQLVLGVTELDLYIPILTFVFGEAQLGGSVALVSYHRLTQEFYGLPPDPGLLTERLIKEAVHEAGHTTGLTHCDDYECVMAATHAVEWLDLKSAAFCAACRPRVL